MRQHRLTTANHPITRRRGVDAILADEWSDFIERVVRSRPHISREALVELAVLELNCSESRGHINQKLDYEIRLGRVIDEGSGLRLAPRLRRNTFNNSYAANHIPSNSDIQNNSQAISPSGARDTMDTLVIQILSDRETFIDEHKLSNHIWGQLRSHNVEPGRLHEIVIDSLDRLFRSGRIIRQNGFVKIKKDDTRTNSAHTIGTSQRNIAKKPQRSSTIVSPQYATGINCSALILDLTEKHGGSIHFDTLLDRVRKHVGDHKDLKKIVSHTIQRQVQQKQLLRDGKLITIRRVKKTTTRNAARNDNAHHHVPDFTDTDYNDLERSMLTSIYRTYSPGARATKTDLYATAMMGLGLPIPHGRISESFAALLKEEERTGRVQLSDDSHFMVILGQRTVQGD